ncbi:MAG TPA: sialidase family protein, partial [bacterium]|nr:sialidase family protein [bacterium]
MRILLILTGLLIGGRAADPGPSAGDPEAAIDPAPPPRELPRVTPDLPERAEGRPSAPAAAALPDGTALLVWESRREGAQADILFSRREPGPEGGWLGEPFRLDTDPPGAVRSLEPRIAVGQGETVHVAWQSARDGEDDILVRRSPDGGRSWAPEIRVDGDPPGASLSSMPALAADRRGRVYVAWEDQRNGDRDIYLARSTDGGATFRPEVRVDADEPGAGVSYHPDLLCWDDGTVLVFWRDERDGLADVYLRRSTDAGRS